MNRIIRYLRFQQTYAIAPLLQELPLLDASWKPHFNTYDYEGHWSGIALRSPGGNPDVIFAETMNSGVFENTPYLERLPAFRELLAQFPYPLQAVRLLKLGKGAVIREHRDIELAFEQGEVRLHIPLITHPEVEFWLDGDRLVMEPGQCWYINANLPHKLSNPSPADRVHLVIDARVDQPLYDLFTAGQHAVYSDRALDASWLDEKSLEFLLTHPDPQVQAWARGLQGE